MLENNSRETCVNLQHGSNPQERAVKSLRAISNSTDGLLFNTGTQPKEETKMKKRTLIIAALAMLATTAASAQTINVKAKVPFSFVVGKVSLPAGEYSLQSLGLGHAVEMRNRDAKIAKLVLSNICQSRTATKNKLIFHRYGESYFLSQIWTEGSSLVYDFPMSAREKEMTKNYPTKEVVLLALNR